MHCPDDLKSTVLLQLIVSIRLFVDDAVLYIMLRHHLSLNGILDGLAKVIAARTPQACAALPGVACNAGVLFPDSLLQYYTI